MIIKENDLGTYFFESYKLEEYIDRGGDYRV